MAVVTPRRTADTDERSLDERVAELEALIEEARRRTRRRRRRIRAVALAVLVVAGAAVYTGGDGVRVGTARSAGGDPAPAATLDRGASWSAPTGPPGFRAAINPHPSRPSVFYLYPRTGDRVFRSMDGGRSWSSGRHVASRIDALVVDPRNGSILYAGTGDGVVKSTDAGRTWRRSGLAPPPARREHAGIEGWVSSIAIDPANSSIVYASNRGGVYRSRDAGSTWHPVRQSAPQTMTTGVHAAGPGILYATVVSWGSSRAAIGRSTDEGKTWNAVLDGSWSLTVDPTREGTIWAVGERGLRVTRDGGTTWREPGRPPAGNLGSVIVDPRRAATVYVPAWERGLSRSTDGGRSWKPFGTNHDLDGLVIDPRAPNTMYAADGFGAVRSADGGATWKRADAGITASGLNAVAPGNSNAATIYAGGSFGLSRSDDQGRTWTGLRTSGTSAIAVDPNDHRHVLVGQAGIVASRDGGATWANVMRAPPTGEYDEVRAIAFEPQNPLVVLASTTVNGLARSIDGGRSWRPVGGARMGWVSSFAFDAERQGIVYAAGAGGSVASSTDGGVTWLPGSIPGVGIKNVQSIAIAPSQPRMLYAATEVGVARSTDGGASWRLVKVRGLNCVAVAIDPKRADTVYVASEQRGVLRSTDGGVSWQPFGKLLPSRSISTLAFDATGTVLYAGTNGAGLTSIRVR